MKSALCSFAVILISYVLAVVLIRVSDFILVSNTSSCLSLFYFSVSLLHNVISCCALSSVLLLVYLTCIALGQRISSTIVSIMLALFILAEICLDVFSYKGGVLLGVEILLRPFNEMYGTVMATYGNRIWCLLFLFLLIVVIVAFFAKRLMEKRLHWIVICAAYVSMIGSLIMLNSLPKMERLSDKPTVQNFITNKTLYLCRACSDYLFGNDGSVFEPDNLEQCVEVDSLLLSDFVTNVLDYEISDMYYPYERNSSTVPDVLSPFFRESDAQPNIVYIIVESLGREWSSPDSTSISYTPFLDSLASQGLYWRNCLSTTKRSFGAVPSLTGSLPHGPKGFQFGNMPDHNSILSILKNAGYQTNSFYASDFAFDCVGEYLVSEHVDYMSTKYQQECFDLEGTTWGTYWGYHDEYMFSRSLEDVAKIGRSPMFNLYVTISGHDDFNDRNPHYAEIMERTKEVIVKLPKECQSSQLANIERIASIVYSDYALSLFFDLYSRRADFKNTIFVITGDHSAELDSKNRLGFYHVPLLVWSPLLIKNADFKSVVSHLDVSPSILALLHNKYGVTVPEKVSWLGNGLDTCSGFRSRCKFLLMDYSHDIGEIVYGNRFYFKEKKALYEFDSCLNFTLLDSSDAYDKAEGLLEMFKKVNNYVYLNNRLTSSSIYSNAGYVVLSSDSIGQLKCFAQPDKPSVIPAKKYYLIENKRFGDLDDADRLRAVVSAEICIEGDTWKDKQMKLFFVCNNGQVFSEHISNYVVENVESGEWNKLVISKDFDVSNVSRANVSIYIQTPNEDWRYTNDNVLSLRNAKLYFEKK